MPFDTYHRNDQPDAVRSTSGGQAPVVVAATGIGFVLLLTPSDIDACHGSIGGLIEAIEHSAARLGLTM